MRRKGDATLTARPHQDIDVVHSSDTVSEPEEESTTQSLSEDTES